MIGRRINIRNIALRTKKTLNTYQVFNRFMGTYDSREATTGLLKEHGIYPRNDAEVYRNLSYDEIFKHEVADGNQVTASGAVTIDTGKFTGRSPKDKFFVKEPSSEKNLWWGSVNQPMRTEVYNKLHKKVLDHYNSNAKRIYIFDGYVGASPDSQRKIRIITEIPWQHHFVTNMFIRPKSNETELKNFKPEFTVINCAKVSNPDWKEDGLHSEVFVGFDIADRTAIIGGTYYGGEMKKGIFSMMMYWLPLNGIMSMHCSANVGKNGDTALYFGLSGTGKTTLSADPHRALIGDDEHGWDDKGIFNFEGGCYAKTIKLSEETEPEIYRAIKRDALLENVQVDPKTGVVDYFDSHKTENGRVSYPIYHIPNYDVSQVGRHPKAIFFLTCDAFGVLPPVAKLSSDQAMYHFLSGYTAKVAGTERGITEPVTVFSACFGSPFLTLHPTVYANLLKKKIEKHGSQVYLINTGWTGGQYGTGKRMSIKATRACIDAVLDGSINGVPTRTDERFGFEVPLELHGVPTETLYPEQTWSDKEAYKATADKLAGMFKENFKKFVQPGMVDYTEFGPK